MRNYSTSIVLMLFLAFSFAANVKAQNSTEELVPQSEVSREVARATFVSAATLAAVQRQSDADLRRQRFEIDELRAEVDTLLASSPADLAALEALRDTLAEREAAFVAELAARDRAYAEEIATYRRAVEDIAATPEGLAALVRFNNGDEAGALAVLDSLRAARDLAAARRIAQLALDARNQGAEGVTTASVITRFEEITRLDPEASDGWLQLGRLYADTGQPGRAIDAFRIGGEKATNDTEYRRLLVELGNLHKASLDFRNAVMSFQFGLEAAERLVAADKENAYHQRYLSESLQDVAEIAQILGFSSDAARLSDRSIDAAMKALMLNSGSRDFEFSYAVAMRRHSQILEAHGYTSEAIASNSRALALIDSLLSVAPENVMWEWERTSILENLASLHLEDLPAAFGFIQESVSVRKRLADADLSNSIRRRDLAASYRKFSDFQFFSGDLTGAIESNRRSVEIMLYLVETDPFSLGLKRDLVFSYSKLGLNYVMAEQADLARESFSEALMWNSEMLRQEPESVNWLADQKMIEEQLELVPAANGAD